VHLTIYNFKGGVGKTSIALNIALARNFGIVTNDVYSPLERVLPEKQFLKIYQNKPFPTLSNEINVIYDLGGRIDKRAIGVIKESDFVIIPTTGDYINLQVTIDAIAEIEKYSKKIIIVANRAQKNDFSEIKKNLNIFYNYFVIELKESKVFSNIFKEKKSISAICNKGGLKAYSYRIINEQFNILLNHIGLCEG